jgi:hypothetical protein
VGAQLLVHHLGRARSAAGYLPPPSGPLAAPAQLTALVMGWQAFEHAARSLSGRIPAALRVARRSGTIVAAGHGLAGLLSINARLAAPTT